MPALTPNDYHTFVMAAVESTSGTHTIRIAGREATQVSIGSVRITVEEGIDRGRTAALNGASLRIGTSSTNDLVLTDLTVSREHVIIVPVPGAVVLEDLRSKNGTWVNGVRVHKCELSEGASVRVGSTTLRVSLAPQRLVLFPGEESFAYGMHGRTAAMREVFALIRQLAQTDLPVAITGETGTGKELVARALHDAGPRSQGSFLVLDCGHVQSDLLSSELFGHERGAFTGADHQRTGILEEAAGGTVFLDEVGEIPLSVQPRLLRALETRSIRRLGSTQTRPVDFRIVCATNRSLHDLTGERLFRQDLYYRLSAVTVRLPPLRERLDDLPLLVDHFLRSCASRHLMPSPPIAPDALELLASHSWPGNVRELKHTVETACALSGGGPITAELIRRLLPAECAAGDAAPRATAPSGRRLRSLYAITDGFMGHTFGLIV